jgi:hypothetical protein
MRNLGAEGPDPKRSRLRAAVARVGDGLARLPPQVAMEPPQSELFGAWAALVAELALGHEPELRACPVCNRVGMLAATQCGYCFATLTPPTESSARH